MEDYLLSHIEAEPPHLAELYRQTWLTRLYPHMCSGHLQGRVLKMLTRMIRPRRALEIGTYSGYSALCIAEGMDDGAQLHTVEIDDEAEETLKDTFQRCPGGDKVRLHIGDALAVVPALGGKWDMAYIDGNKRDYAAYLEMLLPRMNPGGWIIADNTLWGGKVEDPSANDAQTRGVREFNDLVANHPLLETVILPLRDGLTVMRVRQQA